MSDYEINHLQALNQGTEMLLRAHRASCCKHTGIWELKESRLEGFLDAIRQWTASTFLCLPTVDADMMCKGRCWLRIKVRATLQADIALVLV